MMKADADKAAKRLAAAIVASVKAGGYGYTQRQVARALGVSQATISRWGDGTVPMPLWATLALWTLTGPLFDTHDPWLKTVREVSFQTHHVREQLKAEKAKTGKRDPARMTAC